MKYVQSQQGILNLIGQRFPHEGDKIPNEIELAEMLGVSVITIRRALRELSDRGIVERIQGKGTFVKQNLASGKPLAKALFIVTMGPMAPYGEHIFAAQSSLRKRGIDCRAMLSGNVPDGSASEAVTDAVGVILSGAVNDAWVDLLEAMRVPFVVFGGCQASKPVWRVDHDWRGAARQAVHRLHEKGLERIGFLNSATWYYGARECYKGYRDAVAELDLPHKKPWVYWHSGEDPHAGWVEAFFETAPSGFDGLIADPTVFRKLLLWSLDTGRTNDIPPVALLCYKPLTTRPLQRAMQTYFAGDLAQQGVELLFEAMREPSSPPRAITLPVSFVGDNETGE